jgi:hypothetical protein
LSTLADVDEAILNGAPFVRAALTLLRKKKLLQ